MAPLIMAATPSPAARGPAVAGGPSRAAGRSHQLPAPAPAAPCPTRRQALFALRALALNLPGAAARAELEIRPVDPSYQQYQQRMNEVMQLEDIKEVQRRADERKRANAALRGTPEYDSSCKVDESCAETPGEFFSATWNGLNGITTEKKFEAAGVDPDRPNSLGWTPE